MKSLKHQAYCVEFKGTVKDSDKISFIEWAYFCKRYFECDVFCLERVRDLKALCLL
jgi:hypothetical protein